jgi:hypothetical protein
MKREKRTTKKERKAAERTQRGAGGAQPHAHGHIHCIACGKHLDPEEFGEPDGATFYRCQHGGDFPHCLACAPLAKKLVDEHERTGNPVQKASAWH